MALGAASASATRVTLLVALVGATVVLASLLAFEAQDASRSQRVTVERALRDYAAVAAWEFQADAHKRIESSVQRALATVTTGVATSPYETLLGPGMLEPTAGPSLPCARGVRDSMRTFFRLDLRDGSLATAGATPGRLSSVQLAEAARRFVQRASSPGTPFGTMIERGASGPSAVAFGVKYSTFGAPLAVFGFTVCPEALGAPIFASVMGEHPLLPSSVRGDMPNDSLLALEVRGRTGPVVFATAAPVAPPYEAEVVLEDGPDWVARVAVRNDAAARVMVSRPASSRVPILVALLALTAVLAAIALLQLRREHELAALRADFTSSVSHELRTPLAQILLFGETLSLGRARTEPERRLAADTIVQEARRLIQMVENILLFARSRRAPLEGAPEPVALGDLARDVARGFEPLARRAGATVRVNADDALMATADPAALRQILLNLLDNAAKYGPAGQTIAIDIARCGAAAQLRVSDGGPGVSAPDRERIWHPYVRLSGGPASRGGSGIGLSVVRELAESFGGRVWVEDADGGGARFVVEVQGA